MALKPWYKVVTPREDLRQNRPLDASEFAVHLDHIRQGRAHIDYVQPQRFFERTYLTKSLLDLSSQVVRRLSGITVETSAVFNMATQFGGGKTHALTALYHLARAGDDAKAWNGVESILYQGQVAAIPKAAVAVFVGTEFDAIAGRSEDGGPVRKTPWGEIAWQLGGKDSFAVVAEHDAKGVAPAGDVIRGMLPKGPTLILMDELINYVSRCRKLGLRDQFFNFLQNLSEEARARENLVLCASIPASDLEMSPEDQHDHEALKKMLDRVGKAIMMSAEAEVAEIIRRRLFEWTGLPSEAGPTIAAYADWAVQNTPDLAGTDVAAVQKKFASSYPFHPAVLTVFERKWQSLPRFQRTRGVLRLLALWVARAYQEEHRLASRDPLIGLGTAPLDDPIFRAAAFEQLGSDLLEVPVITDIVGNTDAHAVRLDREAQEVIQTARLHRKSATAIFFESNGGMSHSKAEASVPEIKAAVGEPGLNLADVDHALEGLVASCFYLCWDRSRYRFGLTPNLNQMLVARRGAVSDTAIAEAVRTETEALFRAGPKEIDRRYFPVRSNDVPDRPELTVVILGPDTPVGEAATFKLIETILRESGTSGRTFKSALIFTAPDSISSMTEAARNRLAWMDIDDDEETKGRLDDAQRRLLALSVKRAEMDLRETLWRGYRHIYLLDKENRVKDVDLGQITSSMAGSLVELILQRLLRDDEITESVSAGRLVRYWPPAMTEWSTRVVRDAFYSSPMLPRLLRPELLKRTIADGVSQGLIGYARKDAKDRLVLVAFGKSLSEADVEIADEMFILKAEDAQRLIEPPRLIGLTIQPDRVDLKPREQTKFTYGGVDQYGHPMSTASAGWTTTTGQITEDGVLTVGEATGVYVVRVQAGEFEASADVRVSETPPPKPDGNRTVRWDGAIPPQKWTSFYMRVLSKFVSSPKVKIEVRFEAEVPEAEVKSKMEEARTGLRELGMGDEFDAK